MKLPGFSIGAVLGVVVLVLAILMIVGGIDARPVIIGGMLALLAVARLT